MKPYSIDLFSQYVEGQPRDARGYTYDERLERPYARMQELGS